MYHHVRGSILEGAGRENEARTSYEVALELDPRLAESLSNLGLLLGRLGAAQEGVQLLGRLIALHPLADGAYRNRAILRNALGDARGAAQDLEQAMRLHPDAALAQVLARIYAQQGRPDLERRWGDEARRLDPRASGR
jgi:tetratricopeptide (TPR) repeat protein